MKFFAKTVGAEEYEDCEAFVVYFNQCNDDEFEADPDGDYLSLMLQIPLKPEPTEGCNLIVGVKCLSSAIQQISLATESLLVQLSEQAAAVLGFSQVEVAFAPLNSEAMDNLENGLYRVVNGQLKADSSQPDLTWIVR